MESQVQKSAIDCEEGRKEELVISLDARNRRKVRSKDSAVALESIQQQTADILKWLSSHYEQPVGQMLSVLDSVSGNVEDFVRYMEASDSRLLWGPNEDRVLEQCWRTEESESYAELKKAKTAEQIKRRVEYLQLE